ncbi:Planctomycete cytochrome C [Novipirellula galeiformis]|uniref:Planctomycete cytochrome C n=1 Tax=Novipirellula galeiformis TaxID=2528004 RepID=A0A5C6C998_9BACT|nr:PSD1 and planctomycete cytochrome C domain-containing protein [Novipirellula galeiformis]TWU20675.1 Planctomycete cytochrome C [Novipirellula galeiformis]
MQSIHRRRQRNRMFSRFACGLFGLSILCVAAPAESCADDFFESQIRPLLITHCIECHGAKKQESGLRLDSREGWLHGGDSGAAIVPGDPESSLLIKAVNGSDDAAQMPPDGKLTPDEIAHLVTWVKQGAIDPRVEAMESASASGPMDLEAAKQFWSFQPLSKVSPPEVKDARWAANPVDAFVRAKLKQNELTPVGEADKRTLIRRATFDLTGLPPTPAEVHEFLNDSSPNAFASLVDRLLQSPAYGERWGRHWLDVARYADTAGDGSDYPVPEAGQYRDWVVNAFNRDQPFDEFVREQIAGDILAQDGPADLYAERVTATGFLAIGKRYGYAPNTTYQYLDFADVIDSVGRSILGLSLGCARCHDHKFDPVSAADYYALYGIFESTKWAFPGGEEHKRPAHFPALVPAADAVRLDKVKADELARLNGDIARLTREQSKLDGKSFAGGVDLGWEAQTLDKPPSKPWFSGGPNVVLADAQSPYTHIHPAGTRGVRVAAPKPHDGIRYSFEQALHSVPGKQIHFTIDFRTGAASTPQGAYRFYLGRGVVQSLAIECSVTATEFAIRSGGEWEIIRKLEPGTWYTLRVTLDQAKQTYSGIVGTIDDLSEFNDKPLNPNWDGIADTFICDGIGHVEGPAPTRDLDNLGLQDISFGIPGSGPVVVPEPELASQQRLAELNAQLAALTKQRDETLATPAYPVAYGVSEGKPTNTRLQRRGEPERLGDEVPRRFLEVLGGDTLDPESTGSGRLELADWLTRPSNPLTARVIVNRVWQWHFGQGLVSTPSDFGARGELPSHPELLEWLTSEFIASGWSIKSLHRMMMNSQTYTLASKHHAKNLTADPSNRWLWHYARRPLDAESIRDAMLAVSGQLDRTIPPPHPFPAVETWSFSIHRPFHAVYDSNHRSIYLMLQRNRRHPFLAMFDAADPNVSVPKRLPTTTPTQSLFLMNSPFVHQQSEAFANQILASSEDDASRVRLTYERILGRVATDAEVNQTLTFLSAYEHKLASVETSTETPTTDAWAAIARVLLSSNEFLYVD